MKDTQKEIAEMEDSQLDQVVGGRITPGNLLFEKPVAKANPSLYSGEPRTASSLVFAEEEGQTTGPDARTGAEKDGLDDLLFSKGGGPKLC